MDGNIKKTNSVKIGIKDEWCKGCAICVEYCPHDVLYMEKGLVRVLNHDACTACMMCELHCPDFAITIKKDSE